MPTKKNKRREGQPGKRSWGEPKRQSPSAGGRGAEKKKAPSAKKVKKAKKRPETEKQNSHSYTPAP